MRKEGGSGDIEGIVCDVAVAHHAVGAGFECRDHALHLAFEPQIVLIGEENVFSSRLLEGMFKILDGRPRAGALNDAHNRVIEGAHHVERAVGGAIIGNDHFVVGA